MVPRGEVGLVFAEMGRVGGILDGETYAALVLVIAYTTLLAPFWLKLFYRRYGDRPELDLAVSVDAEPGPPPRSVREAGDGGRDG